MAWRQIPLKAVAKVVNGFPFPSTGFDASGHQLVRIRDISSATTEAKYTGPWEPKAAIDTGDVLVGMDGDFNLATWKGGPALLNQRVCCIRGKSADWTRFLAYYLPAQLQAINDVTYATTVKHLASGDIERIAVPAFEPPELGGLLRYLDAKTAAIDALIAKKELLIEELKKYQEAVVEDELRAASAQAAEALKLKRLFTERSERGYSEEQPLAATQHLGVVPKSMLAFKTMESLSEDYSGYKLVCPGDFVISLRSFEGGLELSQHRGVISPAYTVLVPHARVVQAYFQLLLKSRSFRQSLSVHKRGIRDGQSVPWTALREDVIPVPTVSVQVAVAEKLHVEICRIREVSEVAERMVQELKAYRASLISEAVTGKLAVAG